MRQAAGAPTGSDVGGVEGGSPDTLNSNDAGPSGPRVVARDTVVLGGLNLLASLTSFGFQWAMARMLSPGDYADLFAVLALFAVLSVPSQLLLPIGTRVTSLAVVARGRTAALDILRRSLIRSALIGLVAWIVVAATSGAIEFLLGTDNRAAVIWLGCAVAIAFVVPFTKALLTGLRAFLLLGASNLVDGALRAGIGVGLVALGFGVAGGMAASALSGLVGVLVVVIAAPYIARATTEAPVEAPPDSSGMSAHVRVGLLSLSLAILMNVDVLVVRHFFDDANASLYAASALVGRIVLFASAPAAQVVLPHIIRHVAAGEPLTRTFAVTAAFTVLISGGAALIIVVAPEFVFQVIFADRYVPDPPLVWGYTLVGSLLALLTLLTYFHIGAGTLRVWLVLVPLSMACAVTLWLQHESLTAVAWTLDAFLGAGVIAMLVWAVLVLRRDRARGGRQPVETGTRRS
ncbi:MAG: hypothetical protein OXU21_12160 [Chloroflexota bacterium]|nr:hypothetical protein [Chloroflexota bacterium]